jgi:hypothetical protein
MIYPHSVINPHAVIGKGVLVVAGVVNINARLGLDCISNTAATMDHDCVLDDGVDVSPDAQHTDNAKPARLSHLHIARQIRARADIDTVVKHTIMIHCGSSIANTVKSQPSINVDHPCNNQHPLPNHSMGVDHRVWINHRCNQYPGCLKTV